MFGKVGVATLALVPFFSAVHTTDVHDLYNEMYPVNSLKRDAFNICHESDPTFIRALEADRESCYGRMSHNFALAIGYARPDSVRPDSELAAIGFDPKDPQLADLFYAETLAASALPVRDTTSRIRASLAAAAVVPPCLGTAASRPLALQAAADDTIAAGQGETSFPALEGTAAGIFRLPVHATAERVVFSRSTAGDAALPVLTLSPQRAAAGTSATGCTAPA